MSTLRGNFHGFLDNNGSFMTVDDPNGTNTMLLGLNNNNQAVGSFVDMNGETQGLLFNILTDSRQSAIRMHRRLPPST
jgi:hypothetical protein